MPANEKLAEGSKVQNPCVRAKEATLTMQSLVMRVSFLSSERLIQRETQFMSWSGIVTWPALTPMIRETSS